MSDALENINAQIAAARANAGAVIQQAADAPTPRG